MPESITPQVKDHGGVTRSMLRPMTVPVVVGNALDRSEQR